MNKEPVSAGNERFAGSVRISLPALEAVFGSVLLAILIWYGLQARSLPKPFNATDIGAGGFPLLIAAGTLIATILMIAFGVAGLLSKSERETSQWRRPLYVFLTSVIFIAQAAWFEAMGVYLCVGIFSMAVMLAAGERRPLHVIGVPLALVAFIYVVFDTALNVVFP